MKIHCFKGAAALDHIESTHGQSDETMSFLAEGSGSPPLASLAVATAAVER